MYLAYDETLNRYVALKMLRDQYADDEEFVQRLRQEVRSAANLSATSSKSTTRDARRTAPTT